MPGEVGGGGFLGALGIIAGALVSFVRSFVGITQAALLRFVQLLKEYVVELAKQAVSGLFRLGKALARAVRALGVLALHGLRTFITWVYSFEESLRQLLTELFGPVLRFILRLKDEIDKIYKRFVRPIIDAIEFIRRLNGVLQLFGIDVLRKLDATLAQIEARIEEPFQWVRKKITWIENWIDRIVTLDGLFQRFTLIASLSRYAPSWMSGFWNGQIDRSRKAGDGYSRTRTFPVIEPQIPAKELGAFYRGEGTPFGADMGELRTLFRQASGLDPPSLS